MTKTQYIIVCLFLNLILSTSAFAEGSKQGQYAPDFEIKQLDGSTFKLSDYQGKQSVYLVFWNTWCTYCMKKIPKLKKTQEDLSKQIKIIAVNTSNKDSVEESLDFQKRFDITYPLAFDQGKKVTDLYNVWGTPTEFIIDINGVIQHRDKVPEKLEDYLTKWNTIKPNHAQIFEKYLNKAMVFINRFYS